MNATRDHGGGLDAAVATFGGARADWLDLSTGINPVPYPMPTIPAAAWTALPDRDATKRLVQRARAFWNIPAAAAVLAVPGASAAIAQLPRLVTPGRVAIPGPTYNEHAAAFRAADWTLSDDPRDAIVVVHPNNPDGTMRQAEELACPFTIIDESFCDVVPDVSLIRLSARPGTIVLKSFGKFWGLAGLRLGFAIGDPEIIADLAEALGPWPVSGPALAIGADALADRAWADQTRSRLAADARRLDELLLSQGARVTGGTSLFRLYQVEDAVAAQARLARHRIWSRVFPYADDWLRLGLPPPDRWAQLEAAF